jgi:two-component system cell cycle sensor histidine kinase/response regulator CckA
LRSGATVVVADDTFRRADGTTFPVEYSAAPLIDRGEIVGVVVTFTDISERRKLEAKLEQANRLSSLGRLAATIAHEFNNVLMGIAPFVEVIRRTSARDRIDASLGQIALSIARGKRITSEILRFTQPAVPVRARIDVAEWLRAVSTEARTLLPPTCMLDVASEEGVAIDGDVSQLHQTMTNLILNARDAMPGGGTITIRARTGKPGIVHLSVADTGTGMSEETRRHIFEPLFTTKKSGTGLGLPLAHQIVARHGGEITVESSLGAGTTFHLFLPACEREPEPQQLESAPKPPRAAPVKLRRVLLVEDDAAVAAGIVSLLEMEGLDVDIIDNGAEAIDMIRESPPDVVVLDVGLPDMDGTAVYETIAATHPELPVIFSTGHADQSSLEKYLVRPNVSSLLKPYDSAALLEAIERVA